MKLKQLLVAVAMATGLATPVATAMSEDVIEVRVKYDRTTSAEHNYRIASRTFRDACKVNREIAPMRRLLLRTCVAPMLDEFVLRTGDPELQVLHEVRTGRQVNSVRHVSR